MKFCELRSIYNSIKSRYKSLLLEQEELRELGALPKVGDNLGVPVQRNNSSVVESYVIRVDEIERKLAELNNKMLTIRNYMSMFIDSIADEQIRQVVELCVFRNTRSPEWRKIARTACYSETHARRLYKKGLELLDEKEMEVNL